MSRRTRNSARCSLKQVSSKQQILAIQATLVTHIPELNHSELTCMRNSLHQQPPHTQNDGRRTSAHTHQPLQRGEFHRFQPFPQRSTLLLNPGLRLLDLQILTIRLFSNPPLFQIQIQPHGRLRSLDFVPQSVIQLGDFVGQSLVTGSRQSRLGTVR